MDNFYETAMTQQDIVKSLENELLSAETEIKTLKEDLRKKEWLIQREREKSQARTNAYLDCLRTLTETKKEMKICKKKVEVLQEGNAAFNEMWNGLTSEKKQLEDEVQQKDEIIQRETEKSLVQTNAYMACLGTLTVKEKELNSWMAQCDALQEGHLLELSQVEETCRKKLEVLHEENAALNEMWNGLASEMNQLEDEVQQKDEIIQRETEQTLVQTSAYMACLGTLTVKEKELKCWMAQCDALQAGHHLELSQVGETCRMKLEVLHKENAALNETVNRLTSVNANSEDEVQLKDEIIQRETEKMRARFNAYINCLGTLTVKEKELPSELKSCKAQCDALQAGHHLELSQVEETCRKKQEA
ncbi:unnamed protein product [Pleuronectes platessa]|uniref:Uncharacterized protein n=1 Tax=Pleuronectes platessa TaxID=8262 RepID=A0A9N7YPM5_PLEPL|nr:unnamed protein product [Pleuronectes platessa]